MVYSLLEAEDEALVQEALDTWHERLLNLNTRVKAILVSKFKGDEEVPCLKGYNKAPALAKVRITKPRERVFVKHDVEIVIDKVPWQTLTRKKKLCVLDHELTHVEPKLDREGHPVQDDDGRPSLFCRPDEFIVWGFFSIIAKHGMDSMELMQWRGVNQLVEEAATRAVSDIRSLAQVEVEEEEVAAT